MNWAIGYNTPGYMPETDPVVVDSADYAVQILVDELKFDEFQAATPEIAGWYAEAAVDVCRMTPLLTVVVNGIAYWIQKTDQPLTENDDES